MANKKKKNDEKSMLDKAQSDFVNLASHQLRTPLSGMRWLIELLEKSDTGNLTKKQREFIEKIQESNQQMIALVNDLLEVSRIEQGSTKLYLRPTDLTAIIRELIKEREKEIRTKKLKVNFTIEHEPFPLVATELNKIRQVVGNLINNAIAFTPPGGKISIDLKKNSEKEVKFTIADTGVGIPQDQQAQVFHRFFRGTNIRTMETTGTGLGLYIVKAFVEASGGKIWFESQEGKGTMFYFTLPIAG